MRNDYYKKCLKFQGSDDPHFFEIGRKKIFYTLLDKYINRTKLNILDIGCGSGEIMEYFKKFGTTKGLEMHLPYVELAREKGFEVKLAKIEDWPFESEKFDIISLFDVIEHIENDSAALRKIYEELNPEGFIVISVPAFRILWSSTDIAAHHFRRYRKQELRKKLETAGFRIVKLTYFNSYLAPLIFIFLFLKRFLTFNNAIKTKLNHEYFNYSFLNNLCKNILFKEADHLLNKDFCFGMSIFAIAEKSPKDY